MTRINLVPVEELMNQHLLAEYRELPRIVNAVKSGKAKIENIPETYRLGTGHVKFFYDKILFLKNRYYQLEKECHRRNFKIRDYNSDLFSGIDEKYMNDWIPSEDEMKISRKRIADKVTQKPDFYRYSIL